MNKGLIGLIVALVVVGGGYYLLNMNKSAPSEEVVAMDILSNNVMGEETSTTEKPDADVEGMKKTYALADVAEHASASDCWMVIEGRVYDVTDYIAKGLHPGEEAILAGCGIDATEIFNDRPNGSGPHSDKARNFASNYIIGELAQ